MKELTHMYIYIAFAINLSYKTFPEGENMTKITVGLDEFNKVNGG